MWTGVFPAVTTKFTEDDRLDHAEMERCFALQMEAGCDGIIVCGSLGEGPMLSPDEKIEVLKTAQKVAGRQAGAADRQRGRHPRGRALARRAAKAGANGLMVVPSPIYHTNPEETVATLKAVAEAGGLPVMIYSNRIAYRVDVTVDDHGGAGRRPAVRRDQGILRRHPPLDRDHQSLRRPLRSVHRRRQSRLRGAVGRRDRLGGRPGHRLPARDGGDLPADIAIEGEDALRNVVVDDGVSIFSRGDPSKRLEGREIEHHHRGVLSGCRKAMAR